VSRFNKLPGYDQWKTASPYDDEVDWVEQAELWMNEHKWLESIDPESSGLQGQLARVYQLVSGMADFISENV
jgi:hypothetical protein